MLLVSAKPTESTRRMLTKIPTCKKPTSPGTYLVRRGKQGFASALEIAEVTLDQFDWLRVRITTRSYNLREIEPEAQWWGPIQVENQ